jgi:hypothetical protein
MDALAPLLHAFYEGDLSPSERGATHERLVAALAEDACAAAADAYVRRWAAALAAVGSGTAAAAAAPDPLLLHYSLHALELRARCAFAATAPRDRALAAVHTADLVVAAFACNRTLAAADPTSPCGTSPTAVGAGHGAGLASPTRAYAQNNPPSGSPTGNACNGMPQQQQHGHLQMQQGMQQQQQPVPAHVIAKAARVVVELGKREWIADATAEFPRMMLALIDQNGHSAASLPRIFAGMTILTTLVEDALDTSRVDMRASERLILAKRIASIADGVVAALEVGLRMSGPGLPTNTPAAAARTVGSVVRIAHHVAKDAVQVLRRAVLARYDHVSSESLAVLTELYSESKLPLPGPWSEVLAHLSGLLNPIAMGETAQGHSEALTLYRKRLAGYAEAVLARSIASELETAAMERALNGLMGCTMRWAADSPEVFPDALNAWTGVLEVVEDAEIVPTKLLQTAYGIVVKLCIERCMFSTNSRVLRSLEDVDEDDMGQNLGDESVNALFNPDLAETIAEIGTNPSALSSLAFSSSGIGGDGTVGIEECPVDINVSEVYRADYISKCVDTIALSSRILPATIGWETSTFACSVLTERKWSDDETEDEILADQRTAATIAFTVGPMVPPDSPAAQALMKTVISLLASTSSAARVPRLYTCLLRAATNLVPTLCVTTWSEGPALARLLAQNARLIVTTREVPTPSRSVAVGATIVLLSIGQQCRELVFAVEPPLTPNMLTTTTHHVVIALGLVGMARWSLSFDKIPQGQNPSPGELSGCMAVFQSGWKSVLEQYIRVCMRAPDGLDLGAVLIIAQGATLMRGAFWCVYSESGAFKDMLWGRVARESGDMSIRILRHLCNVLSSDAIDSEAKQTISNCIGILIGFLGCMMRVFRRQLNAEAPMVADEVVAIGLEAAKRSQSPRLARALLLLLREQLGDGFSKEKEYLVGPSVALASQSLDGDLDVAIAGVGVLGEALIRHWLMFWPEDVVSAKGMNGTLADGTGLRVQPASAHNQRTYNQALSGIFSAIARDEPSVSRAGMLVLESIHAARKLYSRNASFRTLGGPLCVVSSCIGAMSGTRASLADEAVAVIWGVANADWEAFYRNGMLEQIVRSTGACTEDQVGELVANFGSSTDRPTFSRAVFALVNDLGFYSAMRKGLAL